MLKNLLTSIGYGLAVVIVLAVVLAADTVPYNHIAVLDIALQVFITCLLFYTLWDKNR